MESRHCFHQQADSQRSVKANEGPQTGYPHLTIQRRLTLQARCQMQCSRCNVQCLSVYPSICPFICLSVSLSVCLSVSQSVSLSVCLTDCLSVSQSVSQSVSPFVCWSVCLSLYQSVGVSNSLFVSPSVHLSFCLCLTVCWRSIGLLFTLGLVVSVWKLAGFTVLGSWARHFTL